MIISCNNLSKQGLPQPNLEDIVIMKVVITFQNKVFHNVITKYLTL